MAAVMDNRTHESSTPEAPAGSVYIAGSSVKNGNVDLTKTIRYLNGLEKALKHHIDKSNPQIASSYSIEVQLRPGSLVTDIIGLILVAGTTVPLSVGATVYTKTALEQLAKNDIGDLTSKDLVNRAIKSMISTIKIAKHMGSMMHNKSFKPEETRVINSENIILINSNGEKLGVTKDELDEFRDTPKNNYRDMISLINQDTSMYISDKSVDVNHISDSATSIDFGDRSVFDDRDQQSNIDIIFPELIQDEIVVLEGELTRGNGRTNTLGFSYCGRILKCIPGGSDSVRTMRDMLFGYVKIQARVDRISTAKGSEAILKKPILRIIGIEKLEEEDEEKEENRQASLLTTLNQE